MVETQLKLFKIAIMTKEKYLLKKEDLGRRINLLNEIIDEYQSDYIKEHAKFEIDEIVELESGQIGKVFLITEQFGNIRYALKCVNKHGHVSRQNLNSGFPFNENDLIKTTKKNMT